MPILSWLTSVPLLTWLILADTVPYSTLLPGDINSRWYLHLPLLAAIVYRASRVYGGRSCCQRAIGGFWSGS